MESSFDDFFKCYGLGDMKEKFVINEFSSLRALLEVTDADLKEIGILALGKRKEFLSAIKEMKEMRHATDLKKINEEQDFVIESACNSMNIECPTDCERTSTPIAKRKLNMNDLDESPVQRKMFKVDTNNARSPGSTWLSSPFDATKILKTKNIHLYTDEEIGKAYGIRKKKMNFMNAKLKDLITKPDVRGAKKSVIMGMAEVAWDNFNAEDTKVSVAEVEILMLKLKEKGKTYGDKQTKTIARATERLNHAKHEIAYSLKEINRLREQSADQCIIQREENELVVKYTELQKSTDALRKSCDIKMKDLKTLLEEFTETDSRKETEMVSDVSNDSIVAGILEDHAYC